MKTSRTVLIISCLITAGFHSVAGAPPDSKVIDLTKPVGESLKPDVLYWAFDDGSIGFFMPDPVEDLSGNGFSGKLMQGAANPIPIYTEGKFGTAILLQGNTPNSETPEGKLQTFLNPRVSWVVTSKEKVSDPALLHMKDTSFTAGSWVRIDEVNEGKKQRIPVFYLGHVSGWNFELTKSAKEEWSLKFGGGGDKAIMPVEGVDLRDKQWHHVAFAYSLRGENGSVVFYVDGSPLGDALELKGKVGQEEDVFSFFTMGEFNVGNFSDGLVGAFDDAFVTTGAHTFKK